jgi:hypothetical protein
VGAFSRQIELALVYDGKLDVTELPQTTYKKSLLRHTAIGSSYSALSQRTSRPGSSRRCLPTKTDRLPSGSEWLHEIKQDGFV